MSVGGAAQESKHDWEEAMVAQLSEFGAGPAQIVRLGRLAADWQPAGALRETLRDPLRLRAAFSGLEALLPGLRPLDVVLACPEVLVVPLSQLARRVLHVSVDASCPLHVLQEQPELLAVPDE